MVKKIYLVFRQVYIDTNKIIHLCRIFNLTDTILFLVKRTTISSGFLFFKPRKLIFGIKIRDHIIDKNVMENSLVYNYHLPPKRYNLAESGLIIDLGCNIGLTIAHLKSIYPKVRIIGIEMDKENFEIAKFNTQFYKDVSLINKAVWIRNEEVQYDKNIRSDSYNISSHKMMKSGTKVQGITLRQIISEFNIKKIDFLKMDIEGAERELLVDKDLSWLEIVDSLNIEFHLKDDETINPYIEILNSNGFIAWKDNKHWCSIMAVKGNSCIQ
jgi:FkbM family methyltransferase